MRMAESNHLCSTSSNCSMCTRGVAVSYAKTFVIFSVVVCNKNRTVDGSLYSKTVAITVRQSKY